MGTLESDPLSVVYIIMFKLFEFFLLFKCISCSLQVMPQSCIRNGIQYDNTIKYNTIKYSTIQ